MPLWIDRAVASSKICPTHRCLPSGMVLRAQEHVGQCAPSHTPLWWLGGQLSPQPTWMSSTALVPIPVCAPSIRHRDPGGTAVPPGEPPEPGLLAVFRQLGPARAFADEYKTVGIGMVVYSSSIPLYERGALIAAGFALFPAKKTSFS